MSAVCTQEYVNVLIEVADPYVNDKIMKEFERTLRGQKIDIFTILRVQSYGRVSCEDIALRLKEERMLRQSAE